MAYPIILPSNTWYKSSTAKSTYTEIHIKDSYTPSSYDEKWSAAASGTVTCYRVGTILYIVGDGSGKIAANEDSSYMFSEGNDGDENLFFHKVTTITGLEYLDTSNVTNMRSLFCACISLQTIDVSSWNVSKVTKMNFLFGTTINIPYPMQLTSIIGLENWNTGNVTNFKGMFSLCKKITALPAITNWDISKATDISGMFQLCTSLQTLDLSKWNTSNVTDMGTMFLSNPTNGPMALTSILGLEKWNTSKVQYMDGMFQCCTQIKELPVEDWDVSNVTTMSTMFAGCISLKKLDLSKWNTQSLTTTFGMFQTDYTVSLETFVLETIGNISNWNTSKITNMRSMFLNCMSLSNIDVDNWDTSNVTDMYQMFCACHNLKELNLKNWDTSNVTNINKLFNDTYNLRKIVLGPKFSFSGDGSTTCTLNTPNPKYIKGATGMWFSSNGEYYDPSSIPEGVAATYYAYPPHINLSINYNTLTTMADNLRTVTGTTDKYTPAEMISAANDILNNSAKFYLLDGTVTTTPSIASISIEEGTVKTIYCGNNILYKAPILNLLPYATEEDRVTICGGIGVGYVNAKRVSSSAGGLTAHAQYSSTGFISCKPGDVVRIKGISPVAGSSSVFMTFDSSNTKVAAYAISQTTDGTDWSTVTGSYAQNSYENGVLTIILDSAKWGTNFDSFRFSAALFNGDEIITINEEI